MSRAFPLRFVILINHLLRFNCCVNGRKSCRNGNGGREKVRDIESDKFEHLLEFEQVLAVKQEKLLNCL